MYEGLEWQSPPPEWAIEGNRLQVVTGDKTDFWNRTFYDFVRKDGHLFYQLVDGDFSVEVTLHAAFETLYDQLGLMIRADDENWLKTGLEYSDGRAQFSTVLTRDGWSDWSTSAISKEEAEAGTRIRLTRHGNVLRVQKLDPQGVWHLMRLGFLDLPLAAQVGLMCCSPERAGFRAMYSDFHIGDPISRELHD